MALCQPGHSHTLGALASMRQRRLSRRRQRLCSWTLREHEVDGREDQHDPDVHYQPRPELVPEEYDIHADHDSDQRKDVKRDACLASHQFLLLCAIPAEQELRRDP